MSDLAQAFEALRAEAYHQVKLDTAIRIQQNPVPTSQELRIGCFVEMLEPQVRNAVFYMNRIGYKTSMSGFWGGGAPGLQKITGRFRVDPKERKILATMGVRVRLDILRSLVPDRQHLRRTHLEFDAEVPDIDVIRKHWDEIVATLSARKRSIPRNKGIGACTFRYQFGKEPMDLGFLNKFIAELEIYNKGRSVMNQWYVLRDDVLREERNLVQLGFF